MKILIVDDHRIDRDLLEAYLEPYGSCVQAEDGRVALTLFESALTSGNSFSLILLDIGMPGMSGLDVLNEIHQIEKKHHILPEGSVKVFMVTAADQSEVICSSYIDFGCDAYLKKPINEDLLFKKMEQNRFI